MLNQKELREFSEINAKKSVFWIFLTLSLIALTFFLVILFSNWVALAIGIIFMARNQLSLAVLMHDSAHRQLFKNRTCNDAVGQLVLASPILLNLFQYRLLHFAHHKNPLGRDDPRNGAISGFPITFSEFIKRISFDMTGITFMRQIRAQLLNLVKAKNDLHERNYFNQATAVFCANILINVLLALCLWTIDSLSIYFLLWLLPLATVLQVLLRIRVMGEHAGYFYNTDERLTSRTIALSWQTFFVAPNGVNFHLEHHVYPGIPWYNLHKVHDLMMERSSLPKNNVYRGYGSIFHELIRNHETT